EEGSVGHLTPGGCVGEALVLGVVHTAAGLVQALVRLRLTGTLTPPRKGLGLPFPSWLRSALGRCLPAWRPLALGCFRPPRGGGSGSIAPGTTCSDRKSVV